MHRLIPYAHRGGAGEVVENSDIAVARTAARAGWRLETDVRLSADGHIVLSHDANLRRAWGVDIDVAGATWDELAAVRGPDGEHLIRLVDVLASYPELWINIEPKDDAVVAPLVAAIRDAGAQRRVIVSSFHSRRIRRLRRLAPEIPTGATPGIVAALVIGSQLTIDVPVRGCVAVQIPPTWNGLPVLTRRLVCAAHRRGIEVHVWTIDDAVEMRRLIDLGVDAIMTDYPDRLAHILDR
ncbi:glycerophosphodiester phosphodiesterase family protein [Nanchangia anserum]|uniref:Glycerophosphodiester phosphodiesterase n=1 Tax=Nanchangia anserum TaxID=2692125 RepID=A0A8I0G8U3_9ACTO|nr:glycerophosphodiester phosphodiesterase [Nanchangia anserum]